MRGPDLGVVHSWRLAKSAKGPVPKLFFTTVTRSARRPCSVLFCSTQATAMRAASSQSMSARSGTHAAR